MQYPSTDVLVVGSGAAGLTLALRLADHCRVTVLSKGGLSAGSTAYAQGGISAVLDAKDSLDAHVQDTLNVGAGLCDESTVRFTVERGPAAIRWLAELGVPFTLKSQDKPVDGSSFHLTREGGHSHRRVVHAADATGAAIADTLQQRAHSHPNITLLENRVIVDLITHGRPGFFPPRCLGAYVYDHENRQVEPIAAKFTALATGGASRVYRYSSNPDGSTGDGIAVAWRAGCRVANMEFMQFHPTCLYLPDAPTQAARSFLISEAVRGEGGRLILPDGSRFMDRFDSRGELAPRDIVARAIDHEMKRLGIAHVGLDISHKSAEFIRQHFPNIHAQCLELGFDITQAPLPVVPAAHYTCGGIVTDTCGRTDLEGLYAVGETAYTGLHGANRMASNSLLECLVFGTSAAEDIGRHLRNIAPAPTLKPWDESRVTDSDEEVVVTHNWDELRTFMWDYVGIVRTTKRLQRAQRRIQLLRSEIADYYGNFRVSRDLLELRNLVQAADLIVRCALSRRESRGLHYTLDYREPSDAPQISVLIPENFAGTRHTTTWWHEQS